MAGAWPLEISLSNNKRGESVTVTGISQPIEVSGVRL